MASRKGGFFMAETLKPGRTYAFGEEIHPDIRGAEAIYRKAREILRIQELKAQNKGIEAIECDKRDSRGKEGD